jgi:rhamnogalacturonyl hydrolase YesR
MLLSLSTFLIKTKDQIVPRKAEIETLFLDQLQNLMNYQRPSGAFGNIIDSDVSPDESSLTSAYIFSTGAAVHLNLLSISDGEVVSAEKAWYWLLQRTVIGFTLSDTCGQQGLATKQNLYDEKVGQSDGPGAALVLYAGLGRKMLDLASAA